LAAILAADVVRYWVAMSRELWPGWRRTGQSGLNRSLASGADVWSSWPAMARWLSALIDRSPTRLLQTRLARLSSC